MKRIFAIAVVLAGLTGLGENPIRLDVTARPEGAVVTVDGVSKGAVPVSVFDLTEGQHLLKVSAEGKKPVEEMFKIGAGEFLRKDYELETETGLLLVKSEPEGAEVKQGGVTLGTTPLLITTLPTDRDYQLVLSKLGFQDKKVDVTLNGRNPVARVEKLVSDSGMVECKTEPSGASVMVNGLVKGTTPCTVTGVPKGYATIVFKLDGYEEEKRELRVKAGETQMLSLALTGKAAKISAVSYPDGAKLTMDDNFVGKTPITIQPVKAGIHVLKAELAGYAPAFKTVEVKNGGETTAEFKFESILGWIEVATIPPGAKVILDGKAVGTTSAHRGKKANLTGVKSDVLYLRDIGAGEHSLALQMRGYGEVKRKINVTAKQGTQVNLKLKRIFIPDTEIETVNGTYRGVLVECDAPGTYRLEVKEGIMQDFRKGDVRSIRSLQ